MILMDNDFKAKRAFNEIVDEYEHPDDRDEKA
jgi:hypothetical protein